MLRRCRCFRGWNRLEGAAVPRDPSHRDGSRDDRVRTEVRWTTTPGLLGRVRRRRSRAPAWPGLSSRVRIGPFSRTVHRFLRDRLSVGATLEDGSMPATFSITPRGAFSLRESVEFGFGQRHAERFSGVMRLAFVLDGLREQVGVAVRHAAEHLEVEFEGTDDVEAVRRQVSRVLSLDIDGEGFEAVGRRDPVIGRLQAVAPGLRPPLFHSPYEAAAWAVLSARRPAKQMVEVRRRLSEAHGTTFTVAGEAVAAMPTPRQLLELPSLPRHPRREARAPARRRRGRTRRSARRRPAGLTRTRRPQRLTCSPSRGSAPSTRH